jgi:hypothetical protein
VSDQGKLPARLGLSKPCWTSSHLIRPNRRNDNSTNFAYVGPGPGYTPPEQYYAYDPTNLTDPTPIQPGQKAILKSNQTGMYCRIALFDAATDEWGMLCDQPTPDTASWFTYEYRGLTYNNTPLVASGPGEPLLLQTGNVTGDTLTPILYPTGEAAATSLRSLADLETATDTN